MKGLGREPIDCFKERTICRTQDFVEITKEINYIDDIQKREAEVYKMSARHLDLFH